MALRTTWLTLALIAGSIATACGPQPVRGEDVKGLDEEAMSTGLDRHDLEKMLHENMQALQSAPVISRWEHEDHPTVAVIPMRNETSEHVDSAIEALSSDIENKLVNAGHVRVISLENQPQLMDEVRRQYSSGFDPSQITKWGKQVGARYVITGKVFSTDERLENERRVQYYMFMQVLEVETSVILFQNKTNVTKAMI